MKNTNCTAFSAQCFLRRMLKRGGVLHQIRQNQDRKTKHWGDKWLCTFLLIFPSLKSTSPLHRCEYSLTWLDESLHSLITSNGWPVPTKVWDIPINTYQDGVVSVLKGLWCGVDVKLKVRVYVCVCLCGSAVCAWCVCVCMRVCAHWIRLFLPRGNEVALGGVRGQSALIPLPVRVSPPRLLTADGSHVSALQMSARWKGKSQPGKHITKWPWGDGGLKHTCTHTCAHSTAG